MKILGYVFIAFAVVIGALALLDTYFSALAGQIWYVLDFFICAALLVCVAVSVRDAIREHAGSGWSASALLCVFAFLVFTETWIEHEAGNSLPLMQWLWVDAFVVLALLRVGSRLASAAE